MIEQDLHGPPCESVIESDFDYHARKYLHQEVVMERQVEFHTAVGTFRADFVLSRHGRRVVVECDGRDYHQAGRDEWRDAMILGEKHAEVIVRLPGNLLYWRIADALFVLAAWEPQLFDERGLVNVNALATDAVKEAGQRSTATRTWIHYTGEDFDEVRDRNVSVLVERKCAEQTGSEELRVQLWISCYAYAQAHGDIVTLDALMAAYWIDDEAPGSSFGGGRV